MGEYTPFTMRALAVDAFFMRNYVSHVAAGGGSRGPDHAYSLVGTGRAGEGVRLRSCCACKTRYGDHFHVKWSAAKKFCVESQLLGMARQGR